MKAWYVVNTRPHNECRAEMNLRRQGFNVWLPVLERSRRHARRIETVRAPLFPGYLFIELDLSRDNWWPVNGSYGVRSLLCQGGRPSALPQEFVEGLCRSADA